MAKRKGKVEDTDGRLDEQANSAKRRAVSEQDTSTPSLASSPLADGLFAILGKAFFSPFSPVHIPFAFEEHGGDSLPPIPIETISNFFATSANQPDHPLFGVEYYFVNGNQDPITSIIRRRPFVPFHLDWVTDCIAQSRLLDLEPYLVFTGQARFEEQVKVEPEPESESKSESESGGSVKEEQAPTPEPTTREQSAAESLCPSACGFEEPTHNAAPGPSCAESVSMTAPHDRVTPTFVDMDTDPMLIHRQEHSLSTLSLGRVGPISDPTRATSAGVCGKSKDTVSTLRQVYVDPSAFTSQKSLVDSALNQNQKKQKDKDKESNRVPLTPSSPLTSLPEEKSQSFGAADPGPGTSVGLVIPNEVARTMTDGVPSEPQTIAQPPVPSSPNGEHYAISDRSQITPPTSAPNESLLEQTPMPQNAPMPKQHSDSSEPSITSSAWPIDIKQRQFRLKLREKEVYNFEDVYKRLWDSEKGEAKISGLERV